jgi:hypothetical protein
MKNHKRSTLASKNLKGPPMWRSAVLFQLFNAASLRSALPVDLNADARSLQFNARISVPAIFAMPASVGATLCPDLVMVATLYPNLVMVPVAGLDASLLTNRAHTILPTHALGIGLLGDECNRGEQSRCHHETI